MPRPSSATTFPLSPAGQARLWQSNSSSGQLDMSTPGQVKIEGARRRPDKYVTFNIKDLFNIYEKHNSTNFELCCPLATNSAINPFNTKSSSSSVSLQSTSSYPIHSPNLHPGHHSQPFLI